MAERSLSRRPVWIAFTIQTIIAVLFSVTAAEEATRADSHRLVTTLRNQPTAAGRLLIRANELVVPSTGRGTLTLVADTGGIAINSIGVLVRYRTDLVTIDQISFAQSICSIIIEQSINPISGTFNLSCGLPFPGINTQLGTVATISYSAKAVGIATFQIVGDSAQLNANDGYGTNVLTYTEDATVTLSETSPTASTEDTTSPSTGSRATTPTSTGTATTSSARRSDTSSGSNGTASVPAETPRSTGVGSQISTEPPALKRVPVIALTTDDSLSCATDQEVTFVWLREEGISTFEYELNSDAGSMGSPTRINADRVVLSLEPGETRYFHVRAVTGSVVSQAGVVEISRCAAGVTGSSGKPGVSSAADTLANRSFALIRSIGAQVVRLFAWIGR